MINIFIKNKVSKSGKLVCFGFIMGIHIDEFLYVGGICTVKTLEEADKYFLERTNSRFPYNRMPRTVYHITQEQFKAVSKEIKLEDMSKWFSMKTDIHNKCKELLELTNRKANLEKEITSNLQEFAEEHRKFSNGELVLVCSRDTDEEIGIGMVVDVKTYIHLDTLWLKDYSDNAKFDKDIENLRYEIFAVRKDGTQSTKHFFQSPHFIGESNMRGDCYIKKLN
jgi:hypothetical protein